MKKICGRTMQSKNWIWVLFGVLGIIGCTVVSWEIYGYFNPNVIISYKVQDAEDVYMSLPSYAIESKSCFGHSSEYDEEMKKWWLATNEMEIRLHDDFVKPINVSSEVIVENGKTIISYNGTASLSNGEQVTIDKKIELDFAVSENISTK